MPPSKPGCQVSVMLSWVALTNFMSYGGSGLPKEKKKLKTFQTQHLFMSAAVFMIKSHKWIKLKSKKWMWEMGTRS